MILTLDTKNFKIIKSTDPVLLYRVVYQDYHDLPMPFEFFENESDAQKYLDNLIESLEMI